MREAQQTCNGRASRGTAAREVLQEARDLSELRDSIQGDLQNLQNGVLTKDLHNKLKKPEKLAKRLRQNV